MKENNIKFEIATAEDVDAIAALYKASVGTSGCTWDDEYPSRKTAAEDISAGNLYILRLNGRIIGAVSIVSENELDEMECFSAHIGAREFARLTVLPKYQGKGYAKYMLAKITKLAQNAGVTAWHILVATVNTTAVALYRSAGFAFCGECEMYGNRYYACEKAL